MHGGVLSTLVVVGTKVVCMAVKKCPFGTRAQTTVSVFSVSPLRLWACCHIVDSFISEPVKPGCAQDLPKALYLKGL